MSSQADDKRQAAREVIDILHEISTLLVRGSSFRLMLRINIKLIEIPSEYPPRPDRVVPLRVSHREWCQS